MKYLVIFLIAIATARASIIGLAPVPIATGTVIRGASAVGSSIGLDGVVATAVNGATIVGLGHGASLGSAVVSPATAAVIASGPAVVAAPVLASHVLAAPAVVAAAPATSAVIAGPSGTIATSSGVGVGVAPLVGRTVIAAPAVASASVIVGPSVVRTVIGGHGHIL